MSETTISEMAARRTLEVLKRMERLFEPSPAPGPTPDDERMRDAQGGVHRAPDPNLPVIKSAPTYPMDTGSSAGPPPEDQPRMSDAQGGLHRLPDPNVPVIKSAPTYPMNNEAGER
ncbi:Uncharacterised protein [Mycobacteroides abscessus subsp. abscessus]|uniref:hypothetical protein n=1 Tax=Mycobacteroides abscessus TaxID=36809 RepID=UPI0009A68D8C|nr:hypothetical protein [Mycobacteroides abscessus]SLI00631.1 Uncharacterised protein [Mycobacteroides abscessus subsp. abscessus]